MKPDAWIVSEGAGKPFATLENTATDAEKTRYSLQFEPLYSAATIRKWLEAVTDEMASIGFSVWFDSSDVDAGIKMAYRAMIAAKLQELEGGE